MKTSLYLCAGIACAAVATSANAEFIDFDAVDRLRAFGGIRIEDDVLCTGEGNRVLGPGIPKTIDEVEAVMAG